MIKEPEGENPFLGKFYDSGAKFAFQTELYFLMTRLKILRQVSFPVLFSGIVTDFTVARSEIYATNNLNEPELRLYQDFLMEVRKGMEEPDAVYLLYAAPDYVYYILRKRGIKNLPEFYIENLTSAFCDYYYNRFRGAVLIVDVEGIEIEDTSEEIYNIIDLMPECGVMFYSARKTIL